MTISYNSLKILQSSILFLAIGYLIGSISSAIIYSKLFKKEDIRTKGSFNAGATNVARIYGKKIGGIIFLLDLLKPILSTIIVFIIYKFSNADWLKEEASIPIAGFGTIIGQMWPIFFKFKGGKGVSCTLGFILIINWPLFIVASLILLASLKVTKIKYVSLFSISFLFIIIISLLYFYFIPYLSNSISSPFYENKNYLIENIILLCIIWILIIFKHKKNISNLIKEK